MAASFWRSPIYHSIILEDLLDLCNLVQSDGIDLPPKYQGLPGVWKESIQKMRAWWKVVCPPDGEISSLNDAAIGIAPTLSELEYCASRLGLGYLENP